MHAGVLHWRGRFANAAGVHPKVWSRPLDLCRAPPIGFHSALTASSPLLFPGGGVLLGGPRAGQQGFRLQPEGGARVQHGLVRPAAGGGRRRRQERQDEGTKRMSELVFSPASLVTCILSLQSF